MASMHGVGIVYHS